MRVATKLAACALLCASLSACTGSVVHLNSGFEGADEFETSLTISNRIDVAVLAGVNGRTQFELSGSVSALSASGNNLYFLDRGTGQLLHVNLVTMETKVLAVIRDGTSTGMIATADGSVYVADRADRSILSWTPFESELRRLATSDLFTSPTDIALTDYGRSLVAVDDLDTRILIMDLYGSTLRPIQQGAIRSSHVTSMGAVGATNDNIFVLDADADEVVGFDLQGNPVGSYATDELSHATAFAVDLCGRFFVADDGDENIYVGFADMVIPGFRTAAAGLTTASTNDLWTDGSYLYAATESDGIFVYAIDPECVIR